MKKTLLATLLMAASFSVFAADYYVVVPVPNHTASADNILVTLTGYSLPAGIVGRPYAGFNFNSVLRVQGDPAFSSGNVRWSVASGTLPAGLTLGADGSLSGTPTAPATSSVQVMASYKTKAGEQSYQVVIADLSVTLAGATLPGGEEGVAYSYDFNQQLHISDPGFSPANVTWSAVGSLPAGLTLSSNGLLSGIPAADGPQNFTVQASYFGKSGQQIYQVLVAQISVSLGTATLPTGVFGSTYSYDLKPLVSVTNDAGYSASGVTWSIVNGALPDGVQIDSTGVISGTLGANGKNPVQVMATYKGKTATQSYTLPETQIIAQSSGYRAWSDSTYAANCNAYLHPTTGTAYQYSGATGNGVYRVLPAGGSLTDVYCDMTADGGGWTLVMRGLGGNISGWSTADALNATRSAATDAATGMSFKLADSTINQLRNGGLYRLKSDGLVNQTRFVQPFTYSHTTLLTQAMANTPPTVTYATTSFTGPVAAANLAQPFYYGITDDGGAYNTYFSTNRSSSGGWSEGNNTVNSGSSPSQYCVGGQANCNFTMWVR